MHPSRGRGWATCAFSLVTFLYPTGALGDGLSARSTTRIVWNSAPPNNPLLRGNGNLTGKPKADLTSLQADPRPSASRRLVQLSTQRALLDDPNQRLALVRALSRHESRESQNDSVRVELLHALIRLFAAEEEAGQLTADPEPANGALRHLARGTAAMALAHSEHPLALKKLLATALSGDQMDPVGARLALTALRSIPQKALQKQELVRLFSAAAITGLSDAEPRNHALKVAGLTPESLTLRAKSEGVLRGNPSARAVHKDLPPGSERDAAFDQILVELLAQNELPRPFSQGRAWEKAYESSRVWTLRTLALLRSRLAPSVTAWGERIARAATESSSGIERSAGAFFLATVVPDSVTELLTKNDAVITRAVLHQASEGRVAHIVAQFVAKKQLPPDLQKLGLRMVLQAPELWSTFSSASLRKLQAQHSLAVLPALSSRLRTAGPGLGPDISEVRGWLLSPSPEIRSAAALGLSHAPSGSALGLLFWAYQQEPDPSTRRALVASISKTPLAAHAEFLELLAIDPDPMCRGLITGREKANARGVHVSWSTRRIASVADHEGRLLELAPAPDGFVGIVRSSF